MVRLLTGDLFDSNAQTLVNTVNCVGVMGKGIALEFKKRFSDMFEDYASRCERHEVMLGVPYLYKRLLAPWILNFPTKDHWRAVSRLDAIVAGLEHLEANYKEWGITSLAVPPLGCGHGQLEWKVVGPTLFRFLSRLDIPVDLYAPIGTTEAEMAPQFLGGTKIIGNAVIQKDEVSEETRIPAAWVALVAVVAKIIREPFHWPIGRTTFQKIAYFATSEGVPTGLHFTRASFGPFANDLKPMLAQLVNNGLLTERKLGRMLAVETGPTAIDAMRRYRDEIGQWRDSLRKITDLFLRMQTRDAEIAATVVFATRELFALDATPLSETDVLAEVKRWKARRRPVLEDIEVGAAIRNLNLLGWVNLRVCDDLPVPEELF